MGHNRLKDRSERDRLGRQGDGNCFWRALSQKRWRQTKRALKWRFHQGGHNLPVADQLQIDAAFRKNHWNNAVVIRYVAEQLSTAIAIHRWDPQSQAWRCAHYVEPAVAQPGVIQMTFATSHYDRLRGGPTPKELIRRLNKDGSMTPYGGHPTTPPPAQATEKMDTACQKKIQDEKMATRQGKQRRLMKSIKKVAPPHCAACLSR